VKTILLILLGLLATAAGIFVGVKYPQHITGGMDKTRSFFTNMFSTWLHTEKTAAAEAGIPAEAAPQSEAI